MFDLNVPGSLRVSYGALSQPKLRGTQAGVVVRAQIACQPRHARQNGAEEKLTTP